MYPFPESLPLLSAWSYSDFADKTKRRQWGENRVTWSRTSQYGQDEWKQLERAGLWCEYTKKSLYLNERFHCEAPPSVFRLLLSGPTTAALFADSCCKWQADVSDNNPAVPTTQSLREPQITHGKPQSRQSGQQVCKQSDLQPVSTSSHVLSHIPVSRYQVLAVEPTTSKYFLVFSLANDVMIVQFITQNSKQQQSLVVMEKKKQHVRSRTCRNVCKYRSVLKSARSLCVC